MYLHNLFKELTGDRKNKKQKSAPIDEAVGETKEAPAGTYFTKTGNLVRGKLTKDAKARGARQTDPKDNQRSKVPPVTQMTEAQFDEAAGEKDACYHKVKSRYKVWPSAYASGALVQCRKKGAKNWGNSKKKSNENVEMDSKLDVDKLLTSLRNSKTTNSDRLADAIEMRFMHNMTFKEIGEELDVSVERARQIILKALRLLRWHAARSPGS